MWTTRLKIFGNSNLVVQQVMNRRDAVIDNMTVYRNLYYYLEQDKHSGADVVPEGEDMEPVEVMMVETTPKTTRRHGRSKAHSSEIESICHCKGRVV
jgi:hypothetical protein